MLPLLLLLQLSLLQLLLLHLLWMLLLRLFPHHLQLLLLLLHWLLLWRLLMPLLLQLLLWQMLLTVGCPMGGRRRCRRCFRWGMDIGIQPDAYLLQQMQDALTPTDARDADRLALGVAELLQAQPEMQLAAEAKRSFGLSRAWTEHEGRDEAPDAEERYSTGDLPPTASDVPTPVSVSDDPLASMSTFLRQERMLSEEGASQDAEQSIEAPAAEETTSARTETGRIAWLLKAIGLDGRQK